MRRKRQAETMPEELQLAIGLVWGHLNAYQYEDAYNLALGCLQLWPQEPKLQLMCDYAAAELMEPVDQQRLRALRTPENSTWIDLLLRRVQYQLDGATAGSSATASLPSHHPNTVVKSAANNAINNAANNATNNVINMTRSAVAVVGAKETS